MNLGCCTCTVLWSATASTRQVLPNTYSSEVGQCASEKRSLSRHRCHYFSQHSALTLYSGEGSNTDDSALWTFECNFWKLTFIRQAVVSQRWQWSGGGSSEYKYRASHTSACCQFRLFLIFFAVCPEVTSDDGSYSARMFCCGTSIASAFPINETSWAVEFGQH